MYQKNEKTTEYEKYIICIQAYKNWQHKESYYHTHVNITSHTFAK